MLQQGWNTWNVRSVLSHVHLPDGFAVSLGIKDYAHGRCLREALIGRHGQGVESVVPGTRSSDGSYTSLELTWGDVRVRVETAVDHGHWFAVVTPLSTHVKTPALTVEAAVLWNRPGFVRRDGDQLVLSNDQRTVTVRASGVGRHEEPVVEMTAPYLLVPLNGPIAVTTDPARLGSAGSIVAEQGAACQRKLAAMNEASRVMQTCLAWDTLHDPFNDRVISPVSRIWSCNWGGWVLFEWDTYFAAWMASVYDKELAYANARAISSEVTETGFVASFAHPSGFKDRLKNN